MSNRFLDAFSVRLIGYLLIMQPTDVCCQEQLSRKYEVAKTGSNYCPGPEDAMLTYNARSKIKCAAVCSSQECCLYFSYYATSRLCYFYSFGPQELFNNSDCTFMMERDAHPCCPENGVRQLITIELGDGPILVPSVNNWIILMHRFDGSLDFNGNWTEYKNGFGDIGRGEFWLGNEMIHRLTNTSGTFYTLHIEVQPMANKLWYCADYATFSVHSESSKYAIRLSGFSGNDGNSLGDHDGMRFSTWDDDNDGIQNDNCASLHAGGWWFGRADIDPCGRSYLTTKITFQWFGLKYLDPNGVYRLRAARMMIRSV